MKTSWDRCVVINVAIPCIPLSPVLQRLLGVQRGLVHPEVNKQRRDRDETLVFRTFKSRTCPVVILTFSPLCPGLPVRPTGPSVPGDPAAPGRPSGPELPLSPWKHPPSGEFTAV